MLESTLGKTNQEVLNILLDLGFAYEKKGDRRLAIEYYNRASINKENAGIIKIYRNLGNIYTALNEKDSAEKYYAASIKSANKILSGNFAYESRNNRKVDIHKIKAYLLHLF